METDKRPHADSSNSNAVSDVAEKVSQALEQILAQRFAPLEQQQAQLAQEVKSMRSDLLEARLLASKSGESYASARSAPCSRLVSPVTFKIKASKSLVQQRSLNKISKTVEQLNAMLQQEILASRGLSSAWWRERGAVEPGQGKCESPRENEEQLSKQQPKMQPTAPTGQNAAFSNGNSLKSVDVEVGEAGGVGGDDNDYMTRNGQPAQREVKPSNPHERSPCIPGQMPRPATNMSLPPDDSHSFLPVTLHDPASPIVPAPPAQPPPPPLASARLASKEIRTTASIRRGSEVSILSNDLAAYLPESEEETSTDIFCSSCFLRQSAILCVPIGLLVVAELGLSLGLRLRGLVPWSWCSLREVSSLLYGLGSIACVFCSQKASALLLPDSCFQKYAQKNHMFDAWNVVSRRARLHFVAGWVVLTASFTAIKVLASWTLSEQLIRAGHDYQADRVWILLYLSEILSFVTFAMCSALIAMVGFMQCHLMVGIDQMLDRWCSDLFEDPDFAMGVRTWNVLQALLRCTGIALEKCFVLVQTLTLLGLGFLAWQLIGMGLQPDLALDSNLLLNVLYMLPLVLLAALAAKLFVNGAHVTEKCMITPSLVNQLVLQDCYEIDHDRQYLVQYIHDSSAGIYVLGTRLTQSLVLKLGYAIGAVTFALLGVVLRART